MFIPSRAYAPDMHPAVYLFYLIFINDVCIERHSNVIVSPCNHSLVSSLNTAIALLFEEFYIILYT